MKAGFKPVLFTKKEWQDNRSPACKGSGVGEALDEWQKTCKAPIGDMDVPAIAKAAATAQKLMAALGKAEGKCGPQQKETKAGIGEYKKIVVKFQAALKAANVALAKRKAEDEHSTSLDKFYAKIKSDGDYKASVIAFAKKTQADMVVDAWLLWKEKKYTDMVKKYGKDNDYNIPGPANKILMDIFVNKAPLTKDLTSKVPGILGGTMQGSFQQMLGSAGVMGQYKKSAEFKNYVEKKHPIANFKP